MNNSIRTSYAMGSDEVLKHRMKRDLIVAENDKNNLVEFEYRGSLYSAKRFATKSRKKTDSIILIYDYQIIENKKEKRILAENVNANKEWINHVNVDFFDYDYYA